jgi:hypothetical protein
MRLRKSMVLIGVVTLGSVTELADALAPVYVSQRWRWGGGSGVRSRIPTADEIASCIRMLMLDASKSGQSETGGLAVIYRGGSYSLYCDYRLVPQSANAEEPQPTNDGPGERQQRSEKE